MKIPVMPALLQFREEERRLISEKTHVEEIKFRDDNNFPLFQGEEDASSEVEASYPGEVTVEGGAAVN